MLAAGLSTSEGPLAPGVARAQDSDQARGPADPYQGHLITEVRLEGLARVDEQLVRNQLRTAPGQPLDWDSVREDLRRLERLGEFSDIQADLALDPDIATNPDQSVIVIFRLKEALIVQDVVVVGNRQIPDEQIREVVSTAISLMPGIPIDEFQIGRAQRAIEQLYRGKGYYQVEVVVDRTELEDAGIIAFRVREGERIRITSIRFDGNVSIANRLLRTAIKTKESGLLRKGVIDEEALDVDVNAIINFYLDRGYLDARAARQITPSPNGREAIVTFLIDEGPQYTLRRIDFEREGAAPGTPDEMGPGPVFSVEQIAGLVPLKPGDVFSRRTMNDAVTAVTNAYLKLGYVDASVRQTVRRDPDQPVIDVTLVVREGRRFKTGLVTVQGNEVTQQKVVRRRIDIRPDRWLDAAATQESEERLQRTRLFDPQGVKVTIQPENPSTPGYRDVLVQVKETNTGSLSFGAAVGSDAGIIGQISLNQRNFDLGDFPDSLGEFARGRAFRGAGQTFNLSLQPGNDVSTYSVAITEPALFESQYSLSTQVFFRQRRFREFDENRSGARLSVGRRFGTRWNGSIGFRAENIDISDVDANSAVDFFDIEGANLLLSVSGSLRRNTLDNQFRATKGTVTDLGIEQVGALGGDFNYTKLSFQHKVYIPIAQDVLGRQTALLVAGRVGYILPADEAPVFERLFLGGQSFRGFRFRGVGPDGVRKNGSNSGDKVGDDWLLFLGLQLEKPLWQELISAVLFVDAGTITSDPGFDELRVSVGAGIRLYLPQLGPAPLAFDFGFPILKEDGDDTQLFSFSVDLPFQ